MSSGSLVIVDKAEPGTEHETRPQPASVSQTAGDLPQEVEVCFASLADVAGRLRQREIFDVAIGQSVERCGNASGTPLHLSVMPILAGNLGRE